MSRGSKVRRELKSEGRERAEKNAELPTSDGQMNGSRKRRRRRDWQPKMGTRVRLKYSEYVFFVVRVRGLEDRLCSCVSLVADLKTAWSSKCLRFVLLLLLTRLLSSSPAGRGLRGCLVVRSTILSFTLVFTRKEVCLLGIKKRRLSATHSFLSSAIFFSAHTHTLLDTT